MEQCNYVDIFRGQCTGEMNHLGIHTPINDRPLTNNEEQLKLKFKEIEKEN